MKKRIPFLIIGLFISLILLTSCAALSGSTDPNDLIGTWEEIENNVRFRFTSSGKYYQTLNGSSKGDGEYEAYPDGRITFNVQTDSFGNRCSSDCEYTGMFKITAGVLRLENKSVTWILRRK